MDEDEQMVLLVMVVDGEEQRVLFVVVVDKEEYRVLLFKVLLWIGMSIECCWVG